MKLVYSNGKKLEVYDLGPPVIAFRAGSVPIKHNGYRIVEDDVAREIVRDVLKAGIYTKE
jgi:hypothetical protein